MVSLDFGNPLVVLVLVLASIGLLDFVLAGGAMTSTAACGMTGAMSTPVGWIGLFLILAIILLVATGGTAVLGGILRLT